jgi:glucosylceramidase
MSQLILTAKGTDHRLSVVDSKAFQTKKADHVLTLDKSRKFQSILGFGGAFTESACYNLYRVSPAVREQAIRAYFDPEQGIGYQLGRVSIHGCDFSLSSYTYIEEGDADLKTFNIQRDFNYVIPTIKRAEELAGKPILLLGSPWTPPSFMKDNNSPIRGGHLLEAFADSWARYYLRFIQEYRKAGLTMWGVSVQNEPAAVQRWDSCIYSPEQERDFVKHHLGPVLKNSDAKDVNILIWDHNRDIIVERVTPILSDPETAKYVWGTAFHWYVSLAFENVGKVHDLFPDKGLLFTEGCIEGGVKMDDWNSGERYATNMIGDLQNHCQGYIDWNLWLDNLGGPNWVNNLCDAPILLDIFPERIIKQSSYYYIGHISKYVLPGARRIASKLDTPTLEQVAFENPNGEVVVVLMNKTAIETSVKVVLNQSEQTLRVLPRSIATIVL